MNKIGKRILAAAVASSVLVTPVFADPSVDDLKKSKESAQNEVSSLQTQLNTVVGKITELESQLSSKVKRLFRHSQIWKMPRQKNRKATMSKKSLAKVTAVSLLPRCQRAS